MATDDAPAIDDARTRILTAAGRLIAEHGPEGVSLRRITREAGQRNTTALQYHFGDRDGVLRALVDRFTPQISARRHALLDRAIARRDVSLREGAIILVSPLLAELATAEGRDFLQVAAHLVNRSDELAEPDSALGALAADPQGSLVRWAGFVAPHMPTSTIGAPFHRRFAAIRFAHIELGRRARTTPGDSTHELFAAQLADLVAAILGAELSSETQRILDERPASM